MIGTCLNKTQVESRIGRTLTQDDYEMLVDQCMNGVYDLHGTISFGRFLFQYMIGSPIYRNLACAQCNAASSVTCLSDKNIRTSIPIQCMAKSMRIATTTSPPTDAAITTMTSPPTDPDTITQL